MSDSIKTAALVASLFVSSMLTTQAIHADSVEFTAGVPNGQTSFVGLIGFSLADGQESAQVFETDVSPGMTGNDVVTSMEVSLQATSAFQGTVAGNTLTVEGVCEADVFAPVEVDLSFEMDTSGCGGGIPPLPDLPLAVERRDEWARIVLLGDRTLKPAPVRAAGRMRLALTFGSHDIDVQVGFYEGMTTADIARELDKEFRRTDYLAGVKYVGLDDHYLPTFESREGAFRMRSNVVADGNPGFQIGAAALVPAGREVRFLRPLDVKFVLSLNDPMRPQLCRELPGPSRCPPILTGGWAAGGGIPTIDPPLAADVPNVRVSFVAQDISNQVVAGGGVETTGADVSFVSWFTTSTAADVEKTGPYGWALPGPGETWQNISHTGGGGGLLIYDALVLDACDTFGSFPVAHTATVHRLDGTELGKFQGVDNSTLDATGFYNFSYSVRAEDATGGVSDFLFSGKVNVTCSGSDSLP